MFAVKRVIRDPHRNRQMCHATLVAADLLVRDRCCDRKHSIVFAIEALARDPHRDRTSSCVVTTGQRSRWMRRLATGLRSSSTTQLRCSFSIIAVIGRALPVHRGRNWMEGTACHVPLRWAC